MNIINEESRWAMKECLENIQNGNYARSFIDKGQSDYLFMTACRSQNAAREIEQVGERRRSMMLWLSTNALMNKSKN